MPIAQSRMIDLINAGLDYQQAFRQLQRLIASQAHQVAGGAVTAEAALSFIRGVSGNDQAFIVHPVDSATTLAVEAKHFRSMAKTNISAARRARRRRGQGELEEQITSIGNGFLPKVEYSPAAASQTPSNETPNHTFALQSPSPPADFPPELTFGQQQLDPYQPETGGLTQRDRERIAEELARLASGSSGGGGDQ